MLESLSDPRNADPLATPTAGELVDVIRAGLRAQGHSDDYAAGYIAAQQADGVLRPHAPAWIRKSAAARFKSA